MNKVALFLLLCVCIVHGHTSVEYGLDLVEDSFKTSGGRKGGVVDINFSVKFKPPRECYGEEVNIQVVGYEYSLEPKQDFHNDFGY